MAGGMRVELVAPGARWRRCAKSPTRPRRSPSATTPWHGTFSANPPSMVAGIAEQKVLKGTSRLMLERGIILPALSSSSLSTVMTDSGPDPD